MRNYKSRNLSRKMLLLSMDLILNVNLIYIIRTCSKNLKVVIILNFAGHVQKCFFDYDAALITLPNAFHFDSYVNAACLPNKKVVPSR